MRKFIKFLWELTVESFHGTLRWFEIGEAALATVCYAVSFFFHEIHGAMGAAFVAFVLALIWTFLIGLFVAAYRRDQRLSVEKDKLDKAMSEHCTPKVVILDEAEIGSQHFRVLVINISGSTAENVGIQLLPSDTMDAIKHHLPLPLHCTHNDPKPHSDEIHLNPGIKRTFDVLRIGTHNPGELDVAGSAYQPIIPMKKHRLTLRVHGKNIPSVDKDFIFEPKSDGRFAFYAAAN